MAFELVLLGALIFIFIVSFCGLLQKIKQTYERERVLAERIARRREQQRTRRNSTGSFTEVYVNPTFRTDGDTGIFPTSPPPYSQYYIEPPPKYDEVVRVHKPTTTSGQNDTTIAPENSSAPPPYTITVVRETENRY